MTENSKHKIAQEAPDAKEPAIVRLVDVHKSFGRLRVLSGISLDFAAGRTTVVLGPSGTGKSVMLKIIAGILRPDSGEVWFEDARVDTLRERQLVPIRRQIGFLFQQGALFDSMNVADNVGFPIVEHTSLSRSEVEERVREVLSMVGLKDTVQKMPAELSGGQKKRVALARAVILRPKVILYDEPTTGLDPIRADVINELILKLKRELDVTSIIVTHDLISAYKVADTLVMLHDGEVIEQGSPEAVRESSNEIVQRFLKGEADEAELAGIRNRSVTRGGADRSDAPRRA